MRLAHQAQPRTYYDPGQDSHKEDRTSYRLCEKLERSFEIRRFAVTPYAHAEVFQEKDLDFHRATQALLFTHVHG